MSGNLGAIGQGQIQQRYDHSHEIIRRENEVEDKLELKQRMGAIFLALGVSSVIGAVCLNDMSSKISSSSMENTAFVMTAALVVFAAISIVFSASQCFPRG